MFSIKRFHIFLLSSVLVLCGCETASSINPFSSDNAPEKVAERKPKVCPKVGYVEDARRINLFSNPKKQTDKTKQAEAFIKDFSGGCNYEDDKVIIDLDLFVDIALGPDARVRMGDKPTIVVPYFIAIGDPNEDVIAKEVFAAVVKFKSDEEQKRQVERLRQVIPLENISTGPEHNIYMGFQLTEAQLEYNRAQQVTYIQDVEDPRVQF